MVEATCPMVEVLRLVLRTDHGHAVEPRHLGVVDCVQNEDR
jgi:hypothetical protein